MEFSELRNQIKEQRALKNITQDELAVKIGVTRKTINTIENGKFIPSTIIAIKLARFFGIRVEQLFELIERK
jgi:putative transcriptional regulator